MDGEPLGKIERFLATDVVDLGDESIPLVQAIQSSVGSSSWFSDSIIESVRHGAECC